MISCTDEDLLCTTSIGACICSKVIHSRELVMEFNCKINHTMKMNFILARKKFFSYWFSFFLSM